MKFVKAPSPTKLLNRILSDPGLSERIRNLEPRELASLVNQVGLEDCGEIVAMASAQQIERVFDEDLWRSTTPGGDEAFDAERFGIWVEILLELGAESAAEKLAEMDPDFLTMALSQLIWVSDFDSLQVQSASEALLDKVMDSSNAYEIEDFVIFSREPRAWDAVLTLITALDRDHHSFLRRILERCAYFTSEQIEDEGGLYAVLTSEEQLKSDVAYEREKRREAQGFVTPADARAFLKLAEGPIEAEDHISPAHVRNSKKVVSPVEPSREVLNLSGHKFARVQAMLLRNPADSSLRMEELNYLANVIVSGANINGRSPRAGEAAQIVLEACEKGLSEYGQAESFIEAFRAGWRRGGIRTLVTR